MSWRRFAVLLRGLSPASLWTLTRRARSTARRDVNRIEDPDAIEAFVTGLATTGAA